MIFKYSSLALTFLLSANLCPHHFSLALNSDLQIGVIGRLRVLVLISEHAPLELKLSPSKPKVCALYGKLLLVVVFVLQSEGR